MGTKFVAPVGITIAAWIAGCSSDKAVYERCPEGQIATVSGCLPIPATTYDASLGRDALPPADSGELSNPPPDAGELFVDAGEAVEPPDAGAPDAEDRELELNGVWAMEISDVQNVTNRTLNMTDSVTITTIARLELADSFGSVGIKTQVCEISSTPFGSYTTTHPEAAIASMAIDEGSATLSSRELGASFTTERRAEIMGWRAVIDPAIEELPGSEDDPRVADGDQDQNPGVTLNISGPISGNVYVASRALVTLEGTVTGADRIEGLAETARSRSLLGASNELLLAGDTTFSPDPDPTASKFRIVRLPGMLLPTCDAIVDAKGQLFPPPP